MEKLDREFREFRVLLRNVPGTALTFFVVSVILMNLLANKELDLGVSWLALDCGFSVSWMGFLAQDMITKRFGAKASIEISIFALAINLFISGVLFLIMKLPGNWGAYYTSQNTIANDALHETFGGTWYVVLGSATAFLVSAIVNSIINEQIGKRLKNNNFLSFAIRSYISTFIGQFIDNLIFALIVSYVFFGWNMTQVITCSITAGTFELMCEIVFSPFGYNANKAWENDHVGEHYLQYRQANR